MSACALCGHGEVVLEDILLVCWTLWLRISGQALSAMCIGSVQFSRQGVGTGEGTSRCVTAVVRRESTINRTWAHFI